MSKILYWTGGILVLPACLFAILIIAFGDFRDYDPLQIAARCQISALMAAMEAYKGDTGIYPSTTQRLRELRSNPGQEAWNGPYLPRDVPNDPWGRPYLLLRFGPGLEIVSYGADGRPGGEDSDADIKSSSIDDTRTASVRVFAREASRLAVFIFAVALLVAYPFLPQWYKHGRGTN